MRLGLGSTRFLPLAQLTVSGAAFLILKDIELIYGKPMQLTEPLRSELNVLITGPDGGKVEGWRVRLIMELELVPRALR
jgi:hypothetical protein